MRGFVKGSVGSLSYPHQLIMLRLVKYLLLYPELVIRNLVEGRFELVEVVLTGAHTTAQIEGLEASLAAPQGGLVQHDLLHPSQFTLLERLPIKFIKIEL